MRSRHPAHTTVAVVLLVALAGCFTADATLEANGSGKLDLEYIPGAHATVESERARFGSPHVTVRELVPRQVGAFLAVSFDDVTKLSTAEGFDRVTVTRDRKHGEERLRVVIRNPTPKEITGGTYPGPHVSVTLPGRVLAANRGAETSERRVVWRLPLRDWVSQPRVTLSVRYAVR